MYDTNSVFEQIMDEVSTTHGVALDESARRESRAIFDSTLGSYFSQNPSSDDWDDERTRRFLMGQVRRIVLAAKREADGHDITPDIVRRASLSVMTNTRRILDEARDIAEGEILIGNKPLKTSYCHTLIP
jgi:hypothetical protein